jgi:hypothetical protein
MLITPVKKQSYPMVELVIDKIADWWGKHQQAPKPRVTMENSFFGSEMAELADEMRIPEGTLRALLDAYPELSNLMARRRGALLMHRMAALHLDRSAGETKESARLEEMKQKCGACAHQVRCEDDLLHNRADPVWVTYCPNASELTSKTLH